MNSLGRRARPHRFTVPSRHEVAERLEALLRDGGPTARAEAADWAAEYVVFDHPQVYPEVGDAAVWRALTALAGADLGDGAGGFLHAAADVAAWLDDLRAAGP